MPAQAQIHQRHVNQPLRLMHDFDGLGTGMGGENAVLLAKQDFFEGGAQVQVVIGQQHGPAGIGLAGRGGGRRQSPGVADGVRQVVGEADAVASGLLGAVEGAIGQDQKPVGGGFGVGRDMADADGDRHMQVIGALADPRCAEILQHALGDQAGLRGRGAGQEDHHFVAAVIPADGVGIADAGFHQPGAFLEHLVADEMAEGIVDGLEMVDIHDQQAQGKGFAGVQGPDPAEFFVESAPVQQAGQRIAVGQFLELLGQRLEINRGFRAIGFTSLLRIRHGNATSLGTRAGRVNLPLASHTVSVVGTMTPTGNSSRHEFMELPFPQQDPSCIPLPACWFPPSSPAMRRQS